MRVPFTWRPTGWFMIGWSTDVPVGGLRPLRYFSEDLVAYRTDEGDLHVLSAHCPHLGAHIGHGGKVNGDCVECPYHGWGYGPDGTNRYIPYEDRPNSSKQLRAWTTAERHGCIFLWHDPAGGPPRWAVPDVFEAFPDQPVQPSDYYAISPEVSVKHAGEPIHPQITLENVPDTMHFKTVHGATVDPVLIEWQVDGHEYRIRTGWPVPNRNGGQSMAMTLQAVAIGVGGVVASFEGASSHRLLIFTTPVDNEYSDIYHCIFWRRDPGDDSYTVPEAYHDRIQKEYLAVVGEDLEIWRYQVYVENPALALQDARPYSALRKWAKQFYEVEA